MKANELMIGDWVVYDGDTQYIGPVKIDAIDIAGMCVTSDRDDVGFEGVQPIPLTSDILATNFKSEELPDDPHGAYFFGDDYVEVYIKEYTEGLWRVEVNEIEMGGLPTWRMYVSDVHQLQHALRLCNIDKDIEL